MLRALVLACTVRTGHVQVWRRQDFAIRKLLDAADTSAGGAWSKQKARNMSFGVKGSRPRDLRLITSLLGRRNPGAVVPNSKHAVDTSAPERFQLRRVCMNVCDEAQMQKESTDMVGILIVLPWCLGMV